MNITGVRILLLICLREGLDNNLLSDWWRWETLLLLIDVQPCKPCWKSRVTVVLCIFTKKTKPKITMQLFCGRSCCRGYLAKPLGMWRRKKRTENKAEKSLDAAAIYSLERKERLRSVGAYGVLAGLFLGSCSYWVTMREQRTVDPCAVRFFGLFSDYPFLRAIFIHPFEGWAESFFCPHWQDWKSQSTISSVLMFGMDCDT